MQYAARSRARRPPVQVFGFVPEGVSNVRGGLGT